MPRTIVYGRDCQPVEAPPPDDKADLLQPKSAGTPRKKKKPAAEEPKITGFTIVETLGASPFRALEHGKDWVWSEKLLKAGSINWDNARRRV